MKPTVAEPVDRVSGAPAGALAVSPPAGLARLLCTRRELLVGASVLVLDACVSSRALKKQPGAGGRVVSAGYLLVDSRKCQGCSTCMSVCSLANFGVINPSLARIQVTRRVLRPFPDDLRISACRQCVEPECVAQCPVGAMHVDAEHGGVRMGDPDKCIGCKTCLVACPFEPQRAIWNHVDGFATKCDLCVNARHRQAPASDGFHPSCVEACPMEAITFASAVPAQEGERGYEVDLMTQPWIDLGFAPAAGSKGQGGAGHGG